MKILAIDTSTELASLALSVGDDVLCEEQGNMRQHAQFLLPMLSRLLAKAELNINQLDAIAFGAGPGSFTGLRITCSIAKALAYAHDLPLFPVSSLDAIASDTLLKECNLTADTQILAVLDARMQQLYWADFSVENHVNQTAHVSSAADISLQGTGPCILAGVGFEAYFNELPAKIQARVVKKYTLFPHARAMLRLVREGLILPTSAAEALPIYVRNQVTQGGSHG